jgi:hypothetical protein
MGKYDPLNERLRGASGREVRMRFDEIETLLGAGLPKGAREKKTWWTNEDSGHASAWLQAGFDAEVDLEGEQVVYRRKVVETATAARMAHARELFDTGVDQARDMIASGAGQLRDAFGKAAPTARKAAPWVALGAAAVAVVGC